MAARKSKSAPTPKQPVPAPQGEHTEKKPAAGGLLGSLMGKAKAAPTKPASKKKDKPIISLEGNEAEVFDTFCASDAILKVAKSGQELAKSNAAEIVKAKYIHMCAERGYKPENPSITSASSKANFQVKHVSKLKRFPQPNGEVISVEDQLRQLGFGEDTVAEITSKIIKEKPQLGLKKFTDLQDETATPAMRAVAEKIMQLIQDNLDGDELALCLERSVETTVDEGWKDMAVSLACKVGGGDVDKAAEALTKLYSVLPPQFVMAQMIFSGELSSAFSRMQAPPPADKKTTIQHANGKYEAECVGNNVTLYIVKPDGKEKVGTKECENPNHAEMSARKWFKNPDALNEVLASFATAGKK